MDKYNRDIDTWLVGKDSKLLDGITQKIVACSEIPLETAKGSRIHNYLWCGLDFYIINKFPEFTQEIQNAYAEIDIEETSKILAGTYKKDLTSVKNNLRDNLELLNKHDITSPGGCMAFWKDFVSQLPERDNVNAKKATTCVNYIYTTFDKQWPKVIDKVTKDIKIRMSEFIIHFSDPLD